MISSRLRALLPSRFPRGATLDIVCPERAAGIEWTNSNNVKSGTSEGLAFLSARSP